jgi:hypothetical protein
MRESRRRYLATEIHPGPGGDIEFEEGGSHFISNVMGDEGEIEILKARSMVM